METEVRREVWVLEDCNGRPLHSALVATGAVMERRATHERVTRYVPDAPWLRPSESLPAVGRDVLVVDESADRTPFIGHIRDDGKWYTNSSAFPLRFAVQRWAPLPEAPHG